MNRGGGIYYTECPGQCVRCDGRTRRYAKDRCVGAIEQEDAITGCWRMEGVEEDNTMVSQCPRSVKGIAFNLSWRANAWKFLVTFGGFKDVEHAKLEVLRDHYLYVIKYMQCYSDYVNDIYTFMFGRTSSFPGIMTLSYWFRQHTVTQLLFNVN